MRWPLALAVAALIVTGTVLRCGHLGSRTLFVDEGESAINALSVLERGYPGDTYLGLPMFENTLTRPWPESEEYEFRDTSYSRRGFAIYHGWLPIYAMAASLGIHGIRPDEIRDPPRVLHSDEEIRRRILAARIPSVFFGALFLLALFLGGKALLGTDAGLVALMVGTFSGRCIDLAQEARYHSAALALTALAVLAIWLVIREGRWRHFILAGGVLALLFHTSSVAFVTAIFTLIPFLPGVLRQAGSWRRLLAAGGIITAGLVPWMAWTGYLEVFSGTPMARSFLLLQDYLAYPAGRIGRVAAMTLAIIAVGILRGRKERIGDPARAAWMPLLFLATWIGLGYVGFLLLVPAASCWLVRLGHNLIVPSVLLGSVLLATAARASIPRRSVLASACACAILLVASGNISSPGPRRPLEESSLFGLIQHLREMDLPSGTRIYSLPNQHFPLTYCTGMPVQSVAPVRREFLDGYAGEVVLLHTVGRADSLPREAVQHAVAALGLEVSEEEVRDGRAPIAARMQIPEIERMAASVDPLPDAPPWVDAVADYLTTLPREVTETPKDFVQYNPAIFRACPVTCPEEMWPTFFYRFVHPELRQGPNASYAARIRESRATVLPSSWTVYRCPPRP